MMGLLVLMLMLLMEIVVVTVVGDGFVVKDEVMGFFVWKEEFGEMIV